MKLFLIAGEASGDLHGSNLIKALKQKNQSIKLAFWGGDLMEKAADIKPLKHYKELAFMGFIEVIKNLGEIFKNFKLCKQHIVDFKPDAIVLIDYPGFNLRIAKWAKSQNIKVYYYISPKVWAWKEKRVYKIIKYVDTLFTIFPFETEFFKKYNYPVEYVGNPLIDAIHNYKNEPNKELDFKLKNHLSDKPIIALLPGSRRQEVSAKLPVMLDSTKNLDNYQVVIAGAPSLDLDFYKPFIKNREATILFGQTYDILENAEAALVTSGTATLETALFKVPQVVCYIASPVSYAIAKRLIKIKFISLVNLIFDKEVVRELIQHECNPTLIREELNTLLVGGKKREKQLKEYEYLIELLGNGSASGKVAASICK
ncbi:MAG: lipid-A-disaccharide synthase [Crocinitomicaceae bacterium]|jgi:lipid-A-disaccharide synthase